MTTPEASIPWQPLSLIELAQLFVAADFPWWLAGGFAIEAAAGRPLRDHGDIDVLILRPDRDAVRRLLVDGGWDCRMAGAAGGFRPWGDDTPPAVHDIWCRKDVDGPWNLQIMLDEAEGPLWHSRRDRRICRPIAALGDRHVLVPEVILFYKAKNPRPQDEIDFRAVLPHLDAAQREWLRDAIATVYGPHPWLGFVTT